MAPNAGFGVYASRHKGQEPPEKQLADRVSGFVTAVAKFKGADFNAAESYLAPNLSRASRW